MELEAAKCPNCGANIELNPKNTFTDCQSCGSSIFVKGAIEAYREEQKKANRLNIADDCFENGVIEDAEKIYKEISEKYPNDYRGWWGVIRCSPAITEHFLEPMDGEYKRAIAFAPEDKKAEIGEHRRKRLEIIEKHKTLQKMPAQIDNSKANSVILRENVAVCERCIEDIVKEIDDIEKVQIVNSHKRNKKSRTGIAVFSVLTAVLIIAGNIIGGSWKSCCWCGAFIAAIAAVTNFSMIKEENEFLQKLESELVQKNEKKQTAEINLSEARASLENEQAKTAELEAETEKLKSELGQC